MAKAEMENAIRQAVAAIEKSTGRTVKSATLTRTTQTTETTIRRTTTRNTAS
jgi:hypothetical protein